MKNTIRIIDEKISEHFITINPPKDRSIKIDSIKQIRDIVNKIRASRYGPSLNIDDKFVTTEFRSSFPKEGKNYSEQLFVNVNDCATYTEMFEEFNNTELFQRKDNPLFVASSFEKAINDGVNLIKTKFEAIEANFVDHLYQDTKRGLFQTLEGQCKQAPTGLVRELEFDIAKVWEKCIEEAKEKLIKKVWEKCIEEAKEKLIKDDITNLLKLGTEVTEEMKKKNQKLKIRVVAIWFIAECFRYPPMLFYSLITLHNILNGYIHLDDLKKRLEAIGSVDEKAFRSALPHPAASLGSQRTLLLCFEALMKGWPSQGPQLSQSEKDKMQEFEEKQKECLKTMYYHLCTKNREGLKFLQDKYRIQVDNAFKDFFVSCINYYLGLCGNERGLDPIQTGDLLREIERECGSPSLR